MSVYKSSSEAGPPSLLSDQWEKARYIEGEREGEGERERERALNYFSRHLY